MHWLEVNDSEVQIVDKTPSDAPPSSGRKKPPRLPGASFTLPPMPVVTKSHPPPKRRNTVEVEMQWVELVDSDDEPNRPSVEETTKPRRPAKKPIRREED